MIGDEVAVSLRLRRALMTVAALRACADPMAPRADTYADDLVDQLREYEAECIASHVKIATLRRSL
jgi:hypothetical protein